MDKTILFSAEPFAFGPSAKMITIARNLPKQYHCIAFVRGTAAEFARTNNLDVVEYSINDIETAIKPLLNKANSIVNVMNYELDEYINKAQSDLLKIYVDTLFWFWKTPVWDKSEPDIYYCQNFPGVLNAVNRTTAKFKDKIKIVGPLVDMNEYKDHKQKTVIMINFGGLESDLIRIGENSNYPFYILDALIQPIREFTPLPIVVTTRTRITEEMERRYGSALNVSFRTLDQKEYLQTLSKSTCLFTTPGLESPYEAFLYNIPVCFLPPSLNSQYYQLQVYKKHAIAPFRVEWERLSEYKLEKMNLMPDDEIKKILSIIESQANSERFCTLVRKTVVRFMISLSNPNRQLLEQKKFIMSMGGIGTADIVKSITSLSK